MQTVESVAKWMTIDAMKEGGCIGAGFVQVRVVSSQYTPQANDRAVESPLPDFVERYVSRRQNSQLVAPDGSHSSR